MSRIKYRSGEAWQVCTKCNVFKPIANFSKDRTKASGLRSSCKQCDKEYRLGKKKSYWFNIEDVKIYNRALTDEEIECIYNGANRPRTLWQRIKGWFR